MSRPSDAYVQDILESIRKIEKYTSRLTKEEFSDDDMRIDAVVRNLEIIGEASKQLPEEIKKKCPEIDWRKIVGLRDILVHAYFGIDMDILWDIVENKLHQLKTCLERLRGSTSKLK